MKTSCLTNPEGSTMDLRAIINLEGVKATVIKETREVVTEEVEEDTEAEAVDIKEEVVTKMPTLTETIPILIATMLQLRNPTAENLLIIVICSAELDN